MQENEKEQENKSDYALGSSAIMGVLTSLAARWEIWSDEVVHCKPENAHIWRRAADMLRFELTRIEDSERAKNASEEVVNPAAESEVPPG